MVRMGLFLYDHLARREKLPGSETIRLSKHPFGAPLKSDYKIGFAYSDCRVQDSRLVVLNAMDACERGATIAVRTRLVSARRGAGDWEAVVEDVASGAMRNVSARLIVNAGGPWVGDVLKTRLGVQTSKHVRMVKGSHIVVRRHYEGAQAYMFQNPDKRIVFAIPYEDAFTLIGTTDKPFDHDPRGVSIDEDEILYLCESVNKRFNQPVSRSDIVWTYAGVRPLYDDGSVNASVVTRDYAFDLDAPEDRAPVLSIFGGKITTYRRLAEHAMDEIMRFFPKMGSAWTEKVVLPGGDVPGADIEGFTQELTRNKPFLTPGVARRLAHSYGTRVGRFLDKANKTADLGRDFGMGLTEAEIDYLVASEWAMTAQDILWRRSKLGLHLPKSATRDIDGYLERRRTDAKSAVQS
jgi:glycerol-3-phosphate dehydrogenase